MLEKKNRAYRPCDWLKGKWTAQLHQSIWSWFTAMYVYCRMSCGELKETQRNFPVHAYPHHAACNRMEAPVFTEWRKRLRVCDWGHKFMLRRSAIHYQVQEKWALLLEHLEDVKNNSFNNFTHSRPILWKTPNFGLFHVFHRKDNNFSWNWLQSTKKF